MKSKPLKVLFLAANPDESARIRPDLEFRQISDLLQSAALSGKFELVLRTAVQPGDLQKELLQNKPDIVHFSGHGTAMEELVLEEPDRTSRHVGKKVLATLFSILKDRPRVVLLNACRSGPVAEALTEHIDCAIGMNDNIHDPAAIGFSVAFYQALGYGSSLKEAFDLGQNALDLHRHPDADVPEIFMRSGVDPGAIVLVETTAPQRLPGSGGEVGGATPGENVVLLLDLASDNPISIDEVKAQLPDPGRSTKVLQATQFDAKPRPRGAVDFPACADAIQRMVTDARDGRGPDAPKPHFYVAGRAALPVFAHLGMELSAWADVTLLNQRKDRRWDVLDLQEQLPPGGDRFFEPTPELESPRRSIANGRVAVFLSTNHPPDEEAINRFFDDRGETSAGIIEVRTRAGRETLLDATNAARVTAELIQIFNRIRDAYPRANKLALFIAGPATLAFMATRAINRNIFGDVWVPNYENGSYHPAAELPWKERRRAEVSTTAEAERDRGRILANLCACVRELQQKLRREHLPPRPILTDDEATRVLQRIQEIVVTDEPQGEVFTLRGSERKLSFGVGLLDAFRRMPEKDWKRAGQIVFLHEVFYFDQNLQPSLHDGGGRAGLVLEEVSFWADAMAVGTLASFQLGRGGADAEEQLQEIVPAHVDARMSAIEAFDRFEHGARIDTLDERTLRRYLVWHLQRSRAATLTSAEDLWQLFGRRLFVELAPLKGRREDRSGTIVDATQPQTELLVSLQGRMMRIPAQPHRGIHPGAIVEAVRAYDRGTLQRVMDAVRESHRQILIPWAR